MTSPSACGRCFADCATASGCRHRSCACHSRCSTASQALWSPSPPRCNPSARSRPHSSRSSLGTRSPSSAARACSMSRRRAPPSATSHSSAYSRRSTRTLGGFLSKQRRPAQRHPLQPPRELLPHCRPLPRRLPRRLHRRSLSALGCCHGSPSPIGPRRRRIGRRSSTRPTGCRPHAYCAPSVFFRAVCSRCSLRRSPRGRCASRPPRPVLRAPTSHARCTSIWTAKPSSSGTGAGVASPTRSSVRAMLIGCWACSRRRVRSGWARRRCTARPLRWPTLWAPPRGST